MHIKRKSGGTTKRKEHNQENCMQDIIRQTMNQNHEQESAFKNRIIKLINFEKQNKKIYSFSLTKCSTSLKNKMGFHFLFFQCI